MHSIAKLAGLALLASLSACAQTSGLSQLKLLGGSDDEKLPAATQSEAVEVANAPPLPVREERRRKSADAARLAAVTGDDGKKNQQSGFSLPSLASTKLFTASAYAPDSVEWEQSPISVYTVLAQRIRACWLKPGAPKLANHGFHAEVAPGGSNAMIVIYQKDPDGKRGLVAFRIQISGGESSSTVKGDNRRLDSKLDDAFKADLAGWAKGKPDCSG